MLEKVIKAGKFFFEQGWVPATSGNFSVRPNLSEKADEIYVTASGKNKGNLNPQDFIKISLDDLDLSKLEIKPSAETFLHTSIYKFFPNASSVLHVHSLNSVLISKLLFNERKVVLNNYELLKALNGVKTHEHSEEIPIFKNTQDISQLSEELEEFLEKDSSIHGFLIEGHGLYTWGESVEEASRQVEALENLFKCELELRRLRSYELA